MAAAGVVVGVGARNDRRGRRRGCAGDQAAQGRSSKLHQRQRGGSVVDQVGHHGGGRPNDLALGRLATTSVAARRRGSIPIAGLCQARAPACSGTWTDGRPCIAPTVYRSEEHTSELQSPYVISY